MAREYFTAEDGADCDLSDMADGPLKDFYEWLRRLAGEDIQMDGPPMEEVTHMTKVKFPLYVQEVAHGSTWECVPREEAEAELVALGTTEKRRKLLNDAYDYLVDTEADRVHITQRAADLIDKIYEELKP